MIREIASLTIAPSNALAFEAAVAKAKPLFLAAPGCASMTLERVIEEQGSYRLVVIWDTLEAHTVTFRGSAAFQDWRALAGPFFIENPVVIHTNIVV